MTNIKNTQEEILQRLAKRLRAARLQRDESQAVFAARLGISRQSYMKMENGATTTPIGHWLSASALLQQLDSWAGVLAEPVNLFEQFERERAGRQRASRKMRRKK